MKGKGVTHTEGPIGTGKKLPEITPELLLEVKNGNNEAFGVIYRHYFGPLVLFLEMLTRDSEEAKEIAQSVFLKIYENRENINPDDNFRGYLFKSAKMEVFQAFRKRKVEEKFVSHATYSHEAFDIAPDDILVGKELELVLQIYIDNMPPQRRRIFEMSRMKGMSNEEIAQELNLSKNTVRNQLQIAKDGLRELLALFVILFVS